MSDEKLVQVAVFENELDAQLVQGILHANGVESVIHSEMSGTGLEGLTQGIEGVHLMVLEEDEEKAKEILERESSAEDEEE